MAPILASVAVGQHHPDADPARAPLAPHAEAAPACGSPAPRAGARSAGRRRRAASGRAYIGDALAGPMIGVAAAAAGGVDREAVGRRAARRVRRWCRRCRAAGARAARPARARRRSRIAVDALLHRRQRLGVGDERLAGAPLDGGGGGTLARPILICYSARAGRGRPADTSHNAVVAELVVGCAARA